MPAKGLPTPTTVSSDTVPPHSSMPPWLPACLLCISQATEAKGNKRSLSDSHMGFESKQHGGA